MICENVSQLEPKFTPTGLYGTCLVYQRSPFYYYYYYITKKVLNQIILDMFKQHYALPNSLPLLDKFILIKT